MESHFRYRCSAGFLLVKTAHVKKKGRKRGISALVRDAGDDSGLHDMGHQLIAAHRQKGNGASPRSEPAPL